MIRINKSANVPNVLLTDGEVETRRLKAFFDADPDSYKSRVGVLAKNITKMSFDNKIYGHQTVKDKLKADQFEKCCFCESKFAKTSYGDVEHYRPKKAYKKDAAKSLTYPGYYWLAYDWDNLMFSCEICNRKYKRNEFPLKTETTRTYWHTHPNTLQNEDRLLINPIIEDPSRFIKFNKEVPVPRGGSQKGRKSIKVFGLERFNDERLEHIQILKSILPLCEIDLTDNIKITNAMALLNRSRQEIIDLVNEANLLYNSAAKDNAEFALCVRCNFPALPIV